MNILNQSKEAKSIKATIEQMKPIENVFFKLETVKTGKDVNNKIVIGGNTKIRITEEQLKNLKQAINKVQNYITNNNV